MHDCVCLLFVSVSYSSEYHYTGTGYMVANIDTSASDAGVVSQLDPHACGRYGTLLASLVHARIIFWKILFVFGLHIVSPE